jgi:hypothetical protein
VSFPSSYASQITIYEVTSTNPQYYIKIIGDPAVLQSGAYVINTNQYPITIYVNPNNGMALIFLYGYNSYTPINWNYNTPTQIDFSAPGHFTQYTNIPQINGSLPYTAEQIAVSMLGAAETEYKTLKSMGYQDSSQIPANYSLPTIQLNIGNFTGYNSSLQAYNLYMAMYARELLQMNATLSALQKEGRLYGLSTLIFNATNPLQLYGQYGGFVENGSIILPNGQTYKGMS